MQERGSIKAELVSFLKGVASIGGFLKPANPYEGLSPQEADARALESVWKTVGDDFRIAIEQFQKLTTPPCPKK